MSNVFNCQMLILNRTIWRVKYVLFPKFFNICIIYIRCGKLLFCNFHFDHFLLNSGCHSGHWRCFGLYLLVIFYVNTDRLDRHSEIFVQNKNPEQILPRPVQSATPCTSLPTHCISTGVLPLFHCSNHPIDSWFLAIEFAILCFLHSLENEWIVLVKQLSGPAILPWVAVSDGHNYLKHLTPVDHQAPDLKLHFASSALQVSHRTQCWSLPIHHRPIRHQTQWDLTVTAASHLWDAQVDLKSTEI